MFSREAFVKAWLLPSRLSALEPGEEVPEGVLRGRNMGRLTPVCPTLGPDHVGPKALPHPPTRRVGGRDESRCQREPPGRRLALEPAAAAAVTDEVPDLMKRNEVAHLPPDRRDPDLEAPLAASVTVANGDHDGPSASVDPADFVSGAEVVDVAVEGPGLHRASLDVAREVARGARRVRTYRTSRRITCVKLRRNAKVDLLSHVPLFAECSQKELGRIATIADELSLPEGTKLIEEGRKGREFFVLIDGTVDVRRGGRKVAEMGGGSFFGEIALLTDAPRTATVTATSPARVLVITGQAFQRVLNETTTIRPKVLAALAERAAATSQ
jgi:CRP/FNR family cyclic AMP-dependent transcriptional regulator